MNNDNERPVYAERMFPAPVDLGIAQPDRAVCSVKYGTSSYLEGEGGAGKSWYEGGGTPTEKAVAEIVVYPPTRGLQTQGDPFEPVKIGVLVDMDLGQLLADWIDPTILAIEDALNEGVWGRHRSRSSPATPADCRARTTASSSTATSGSSSRGASSSSGR